MLGIHSGTGSGYELLDFTVTTSATAPAIRISASTPNSVELSWPTGTPSYAPEATSSLQPPVVWSPVTNNINILNGTNLVSLVTSGTGVFLHLKQKP